MQNRVARDDRGVGRLMRVAVVAAVVFGLSSCGGAGTRDGGGVAAADHVEEQLAAFRTRVARLEQDAAAAAQAERGVDARLTGMRRGIARLQRAVKRLTDEMDEVTAASAGALAEVREAARSLSLLTERYDFHMRRYHGGP